MWAGDKMKQYGNVIELKPKNKDKSPVDKSEHFFVTDASVTDITEIRKEIIQNERRQVKRTLLTEFIGANVIIPGQGLMRVALYDISQDGLAFDMQTEQGHFEKGESVAMRVYMNHKTYFPFIVKVTHVAYMEHEGVYRVGTQFEKETVNRMALFHFVKFIETVSANLKQDDGDVMVSNIK